MKLGSYSRKSGPRAKWSPLTILRAPANSSAKVMSAVAPSRTRGVLPTGMPRSCAAAKSTWSQPTPKLLITLSLGMSSINSALTVTCAYA